MTHFHPVLPHIQTDVTSWGNASSTRGLHQATQHSKGYHLSPHHVSLNFKGKILKGGHPHQTSHTASGAPGGHAHQLWRQCPLPPHTCDISNIPIQMNGKTQSAITSHHKGAFTSNFTHSFWGTPPSTPTNPISFAPLCRQLATFSNFQKEIAIPSQATRATKIHTQESPSAKTARGTIISPTTQTARPQNTFVHYGQVSFDTLT